jgi:hypothetical protein
MAKDHYIAQTYLKHFIDPRLKVLLHVHCKHDLKYFTPTTKDICFEEGWDTNPYFQDPETVAKYLKIVEPKWNRGVNDIKELLQYEEVKYFMAGYIAVMASCSPTAVRTSSDSIAEVIASSTNMLAQQMQARPDLFPDAKPLPQEKFDQIMESGGLIANVDPKHSHARMIANLVDLQWHLYKSPWLVMVNETESPFLTSDFPVAFYYPKPDSQIPYRYVPISPKFGILIKLSLDPADRKFPKVEMKKYPNTTVDIRDIKHDFVRILNTLTVQGAESLVISDRKEDWITNLIKKNKDWKMDSGVMRMSYKGGSLVTTKMKPRRVAGKAIK